MFRLLLDLLFPVQSLSGADGSFITNAERNTLSLAPRLLPQTVLRERGLTFIDDIVAAGRYDASDHLKKMILTYKYKRIPAFADDLALIMMNALKKAPLPSGSKTTAVPVLCPVPLHWVRHNERGFNQALELAVRIGKAKNWAVEELLLRTRPTGHQAHRNRSKRLTALLGAFAVKPGMKMPEWVVLVDDLCTTGATLEECARALKKSGVQHVSGLTAAIG